MVFRRAHLGVFLAVLALALGFAAFTRHAWEDYYITYRTSKHLVNGEGLVFQPGERLHTFTSPLGVLLPAAALALTGNTSDAGALWIFRAMSAAAFAGAVTLLWSWARRAKLLPVAAAVLAGLLALDAKSVDFSINGMETGVLLLFLALGVRTLFAPPERRAWLWLGISWGGLMWTRPDSFIYIGALAAAAWLFNDAAATGRTRLQWIREFLFAGLVCTALYLPWLAFSWSYYGTPVPNTVVAKALCRPNRTPAEFVAFLRELPRVFALGQSPFEAAFLPSYHIAGGWPVSAVRAAQALAVVASGAWLLPFVRREARVASLAFLFGGLYLGFYPYFPFPWYLPTITLLATIVFAVLLHQVIGGAERRIGAGAPAPFARFAKYAALGLAVLLVGGAAWLTAGTARQFEAAQRLVEDGGRKKVGLYLREHAQPGDTVFTEPLGYIGFYSQLKTFDWPGLSSREMIDARLRRNRTGDWGELIFELDPTWVVLRPSEVPALERAHPYLLDRVYRRVAEFSVADAVNALDVPGRKHLEFDAAFHLYHREISAHQGGSPRFGHAVSPLQVFEKTFEGRDYLLVHAPGELRVKIPDHARRFEVGYCFDPLAYTQEQKTDGVGLRVEVRGRASCDVLWEKLLDPAKNPDDRGAQTLVLDLPPDAAGRDLVLRAEFTRNTIRDWICWSVVKFE